MSRFKPWRPGCADEAWKVAICARDAGDAESALQFVAMVMCDDPKSRPEECAEQLSRFTGEEIARGILEYRDIAIQSVRNALK